MYFEADSLFMDIYLVVNKGIKAVDKWKQIWYFDFNDDVCGRERCFPASNTEEKAEDFYVKRGKITTAFQDNWICSRDFDYRSKLKGG